LVKILRKEGFSKSQKIQHCIVGFFRWNMEIRVRKRNVIYTVYLGMCSIGVNTDKTGTFVTATDPQCTLMASVSVSSQFQWALTPTSLTLVTPITVCTDITSDTDFTDMSVQWKTGTPTDEGTSPNVPLRSQWVFACRYYSALVKILDGFGFLLLLSKVMSVLLDFSPMAVKHQKNQINEFRPEILPIDRSNGP
jgi:hypothetical protein